MDSWNILLGKFLNLYLIKMILDKIISLFSFIFSKSNIYNYLAQFGAILINILLMPVLLNVLGKENFGVWQTILTLISYITILNFGLGNGLRNIITKYLILNDYKSINIAIGQTLKKMSVIIITALIIFIPLYLMYFKTTYLFKNIIDANNEIKFAILISISFFLINMILSLSTSISYGLQKSFQPGFQNLIYLFFVYITIFVLNFFYKTNIIIISLIFGVYQSISYIVLFLYHSKFQNIKLNFQDKINLQHLNKLSSGFFIVQITALIFVTSDNLIVSNFLGASETADYSVVSKIYFTLISLFSILLIQFWNNVTAAYEKKEQNWIKNTTKKLIFISFVILFIGIIISFYKNLILFYWFGENNSLNINNSTFLFFSVYTFLHCFNSILINLQNGLGKIKIQIYSSISMIIILFSGIYLFDIKKNGYDLLINIKSFATVIGILINSTILLKIKSI